ncbi:MAG: hypothetical protein PHG29_02895 [Prolixibacteraceae bacterium]|jgi:hypothetical protein|nr:hypothetical protein [Prolixibacteraceae bacterium]NLO02497.1 hypothetical protein [Bacteroidales bacterium]
MLAIHHSKNSPTNFSHYWIEYCEKKNLPYKIVDCYANDLIAQLDGCNGLMWHWDLTHYKAALFARQLTLSLESIGIKVFPGINTGWHYNDKLGQKYLMEAIGAPLVKSYVFFSKQEALKWSRETTYPKVFKLRTGAGSSNVRLVKNNQTAKRLIRKAFGSGFHQIDPINRLKERLWIVRRDKNFASLKKLITGIIRLFVVKEVEKFSQKEKGYIYFQDYLPYNKSDTRIVVIGDRSFGMVRHCRTGDFRASGSGLIDYNHKLINKDCVRTAFETAKKLNVQSIAIDFIKQADVPCQIIEISYAFIPFKFPGYWDRDLVWHEGEITPEEFMIEDFIQSLDNNVNKTIIQQAS